MADSHPDRENDASGRPLDSRGAPSSVVGRIIGGNFRVLKLIGTGAMGHVYQAEQLSLGKMVALKLLRRELQADEKLIRRFELEAKNASSLNHPNSIQIIDFGRDGELLFIAMELLPGVDLGQLILREGPLPLGRLGHIMDQVLAALDEAHAHGIVHRDLKPGNIMLISRRDDPDFVKVCDFGIAKAQTAPEGEALTLKGLVCGTPEYMSPEQARGEDVDGRSDLYSVGVILYQLVTGELPFTASSPVGILSKHLAESPLPPTLRRPGLAIPPAFENVILHALAKEPGDRPASAEQLRHDLRAALSDLPPGQTLTAPVHHDPRIPPTYDILSAQATTPMGLAAATKPASGADNPSRVGFYRSATPASPPPRRFWLGASLLALLAVGVWLVFAPGPVAGWLGRNVAKPPGSIALPPAVAPAAQALAEAVSPPPAPAVLPTPPEATSPAIAEAVTRARTREKRAGKVSARAHEPADAPAAAGSRSGDPVPASPEAPVQAENHALIAPPARTTGSPIKEAERLLAQGEVAAACDKGEEQLRATPSAGVYKFLGKCYMRLGKPDQAKAHYRRYLELAPDASDAAFIRSIVTR